MASVTGLPMVLSKKQASSLPVVSPVAVRVPEIRQEPIPVTPVVASLPAEIVPEPSPPPSPEKQTEVVTQDSSEKKKRKRSNSQKDKEENKKKKVEEINLETADRTKLTIKELMAAKGGKLTKKRQEIEEMKEKGKRKSKDKEVNVSQSEEEVTEIPETQPTQVETQNLRDSIDDLANFLGDADDDELGLVPAPQVRLDEHGNIVVDRNSVTLKVPQTPNTRPLKEVEENKSKTVGYGPRNVDRWTSAETKKFYEVSGLFWHTHVQVLRKVGTDFQLINQYFPTRTRRQIKTKFKKEEKINPTLIDWAMKNTLELDAEEIVGSLQDNQQQATAGPIETTTS